MDTIRSFIAFPIPGSVQSKLEKAQGSIQKGLHHLRPVKPESIHLTLHFLGDVSKSNVYKVGELMDKVCPKYKPMDLLCRKIGAFPDFKNPRVIWAGLEGEIDKLSAFQKELGEGLAEIGLRVEKRPFNPHLTLFRIKQQKQLGTIRKRAEQISKEDLGIIPCDTLTLYQSDLTPEGAVYTKLKMVALGK